MAQPMEHIDGKYEILEKLKEGGMGAIYKVRHRLLEEIRVIKVMRPTLRDDEELYARFLREAKMAIQLRHPNIAQLYDFTIDEDGNAFIVMEFIRGINFADLIDRDGPAPLGLTLEMAIQSLKALDYLHRQGFVHRDISPDNLMLSQDFDARPLVKLIDLGIAKALEGNSDLTATGHFLGKVRYCSPEQLESTSTITARSDLYSFGLVLYELLTGQCPIAGETPSALIAGHLMHPPTDFSKTDPKGLVPAMLRQIVLRALEKKPENRFASAEEFQLALEQVQQLHPFTPELAARAQILLDRRSFTADDKVKPGSTQHRLDQEFGLQATPQPEARTDRLPERGAQPKEQRNEPAHEPDTVAQDTPPIPPPIPAISPAANNLAPVVDPHREVEAPTAVAPLPRTQALGVEPLEPGPRRRARWPWIVLASIALLGLSWGLWWQAQQPGDATPTDTPVNATDASGRLVVNASPWARVVSIVGEDGTEVEVAANAHTPLSVDLPSGSYSVELRHQGQSRIVETEVQASEETRVQISLQEMTADEMLQQLGW